MTPKAKSRERELEKKGWVKQFTIEEERLAEFLELYESLGFEVRLEPVVRDEAREECRVCLEAQCDKYKTIYTRAKKGGPSPANGPYLALSP